ncbi:fimbria/pilus outer membrane usher protein [Caballeronia insecticola]|uniref:Fimbrial biogenesis outer membrane usher protein n=1 Tax=Caballeronia insecticola TaxID=758793 RepID=R4WFI3_9BURK|nr:fimbria/pilus outer membrane usher protein [Caballeronia insecticola]BAN22423.1 fimbrial biogenesis outer membrane usher protein [Caballeronia insecticola]
MPIGQVRGSGAVLSEYPAYMNERYQVLNDRPARNELLLLSRSTVAVLLAFAATQADAAERDTSAISHPDMPSPSTVPSDVQSAPASGALVDEGATTNAAVPRADVVAARPLALAEPESVQFNQSFLVGSEAARMDISRFDKGNSALPGTYRSAMYVNGVWVGVTSVTLRETGAGAGAGNHQALPVFDRDLLMRAGVDVMRMTQAARDQLDAAKDAGVFVSDLIPQASATFDMGEQRLDVSVPQAMLSRNARGWVDPKMWDDGVPAATLQYNANAYHSTGGGMSNTQAYLGVNAGANFGPWRLRYNGNVTTSSTGGTHAQSMQTYLQRSFTPIKSQLTVGDSYTDGSIFDSFGVRGVQLATDDRMYPESQRGYAPTVRGIANSNASVQIKQNGNIIYETTVAPGPFQIDDLYPTGYGGDLQVIVTEADGSQHVSSVPYAAPVNALREGRWRYNVAAGEYRNASVAGHPYVFEAGVQHGLNNFVTLYGGTIVAEDYLSGALGVALDTPAGAFAFDVTQARANVSGSESRNGQSLRLSYSRNFLPTNTNFTLAAYRYSTSGFLDLQDAMVARDVAANGYAYANNGRQKGRLQLTLNQGFDKWGSVYASGYTQNYWNKSARDTAFQIGYNVNVGRVGVGVSAARELESSSARWDNRVMLNLTIPLDLGSTVANSSTSFSHDSRSNSSQIQETFTGAAGADYRFNYGVSAGHSTGQASDTSINANAGYVTPYTQIRLNAGTSNGYTQAGGGLNGSVIAYGGGIVLTPQTGDTFAIVEAKDAVGARLASSPGVRVDRFGHAVVAGMQPFELNTVEIDTKGLPMGIELKSSEQHFAPTAGAVSRVKFETENRGRAVVMQLSLANNEPVPFGADVTNVQGESIGTVTQGSRAMFYSKDNENDVVVKWGEGDESSCKAHYSLAMAGKVNAAGMTFVDAACE